MSIYLNPEDIGNRALQHLGAAPISLFTDNSKNATQANLCYDKCRRAELRANLWNFAARRLVLRPFIPGSTQGFQVGPWSSATTYQFGAITFFNSKNWINPAANSVNVQPGTGIPYFTWVELPQPVLVNPYDPTQAYYLGEMVVSQGLLWFAAKNAPPTTAAIGVNPAWLNVSALSSISLFPASVFTPQGITTSSLSSPKPGYPLPNSYIRVMSQDAKSAAAPAQLATAGMQASDYEFEGSFLYTNSTQGGPLVFRFAMDIRNVWWFDDLFSEAVAARMSIEMCETITQSAAKMQAMQSLYSAAIDKAVRVNAIEAGSTEPDTDKVDSQRGPTRERAPQPQPRQQ